MTRMFKHTPLVALSALMCAGLAVRAQCQDAAPELQNWYVGVDLSLSSLSETDTSSGGSIDYDPSLTLSGVKLGYRPSSMMGDDHAVRFELELGGRGAALDSVRGNGRARGDLGIGGIMVNAYYDWMPHDVFSPYVGAGIGAVSAEFSDNPGLGISDRESDDAALAGQIMVGFTYQPESWTRTSLNAGYRYFVSQDIAFDGHGRDVDLEDISAHELTAGLSYNF